MKSIYLAYSVTNGDSFSLDKNELFSFLKKKKFKIIEPNPALFPELIANNTLDALKEAEVVIGEVSVYSHGVGFELGYAYSLNKKIIIIAKSICRDNISNFIKGIFPNILYYENYSDLCEKIYREFEKMNIINP